MIEGERRDHGAEADALGPRGKRRERCPGLEGGPLRVSAESRQVVGAAQRVVAQIFGGLRQPEPALPGQAFLCLDHDPRVHDSLQSIIVSTQLSKPISALASPWVHPALVSRRRRSTRIATPAAERAIGMTPNRIPGQLSRPWTATTGCA